MAVAPRLNTGRSSLRWTFSATFVLTWTTRCAYSPTTSPTLLDEQRIAAGLNVSTRCGFKPNARQIRPTSTSTGQSRQRWRLATSGWPLGGALQRGDHNLFDLVIAHQPQSSRPGLVAQPVQPVRHERRRHLPTVAVEQPNCVATEVCPCRQHN
jgi:hypothetical protein